jgi:CheY-like chemotaxis protein
MREHLLIVEDDEDLRDNLAFLLERKGYRVETASNGRHALDRIGDVGPPCLIILDLMMPVMDGWQFRAELLKDPALASVPVVLLSGIADVDEAARSLDAVGHLGKPIDLAKLYDVVSTHCC